MSDLEPKRWKDEADVPAGMRDVLRAGREVPKMPDEVRAAVLAALPIGAAPPPPAPAPPTVAPVKGFFATPLGTGVIVAAVIAIGIAILVLSREEAKKPAGPVPSLGVPVSSPPPALEPSPAPSLLPAPAPASASASASAPASASARASASAPASASARASASPHASTSPSASASAPLDSLAEETRLVNTGRQLLQTTPTAALNVAEEHAKKFPRGELAPERELIRISALRKLGRSQEARSFANAFLRNFPTHPKVSTVKAFVESNE